MDGDCKLPDRAPDTGRKRPPGDFTSKELEEDTARFLDEVRRRTEEQRRRPTRPSGPPPPAERG